MLYLVVLMIHQINLFPLQIWLDADDFLAGQKINLEKKLIKISVEKFV